MKELEYLLTREQIKEKMRFLSYQQIKEETGFNYTTLQKFATGLQNRRPYNPTYNYLYKINIAIQKLSKELEGKNE